MKSILFFSLFIFFNTLFSQDLKLDEINKTYYSLNDYNYKGFEAKLVFELPEKIRETYKDDKCSEVLDNLSFKIEMSGEGDVGFNVQNLKETGNMEFDKELKKICTNTERSVKGFFNAWGGFVHHRIFKPETYEYKLSDEPGKVLVHKELSAEVKTYFADETTVDSIKISDPGTKVGIYTRFVKTKDDKNLVSYLKTNINAFMETTFDISYVEMGDIYIPKGFKIDQRIMDEKQTLNISVKDIVLK